jgi:hypothetical protein
MKRTAAALAMVVVLVGASSALGDTLSVALDDIAVIAGTVRGESVARVVFHVPVPEPVLEARIDFARIEFPAFLDDTNPTAVSVVARDCQTAWECGRVTWIAPWRRPGGDFDSLSRAWFVALPGDSQHVMLNITETVRGWQQGRVGTGCS